MTDDRPTECPDCESRNIYFNAPRSDSDHYDRELALHCTGERGDRWNYIDEWAYFHFSQVQGGCEDCHYWWRQGERLYYNPETSLYELSRDDVLIRYPNTPEALKAAREQQLSAGQLELPLDEVTT